MFPYVVLTVSLLILAALYFLPVAFHLCFNYGGVKASLILRISVLGLVVKRFDFPAPENNTGEADAKKKRAKSKSESFGNLATRTVKNIHSPGKQLLANLFPVELHLILQPAGWLEKKIRHLNLSWRTMVGLGEGTATALAFGAVWAVKGCLLALIEARFKGRHAFSVKVEPLIGRTIFDTNFDCIFQWRAGHIIWAGAWLLYNTIKEWHPG